MNAFRVASNTETITPKPKPKTLLDTQALFSQEEALAEQPPRLRRFLFKGGYGNRAELNRTATKYIAQLYGAVALSPPEDMPPDEVSDDFIVENHKGGRRIGSIMSAYRASCGPEVRTITSYYHKERSDDLLVSLREQMEGDPSPVDAYFQSMDAVSGTLAMAEAPEMFERVVLGYPAGYIQKKNIHDHIRRVYRSLKRGVMPVHFPEEGRDFLSDVPDDATLAAKALSGIRKVTRRPFRHTGGIFAGAAVTVSRVGENLHELREAKGVDSPRVGMLLGRFDALMDPVRTIESLRSPTDVDEILVVNTAHAMNGDKDVALELIDQFDRLDASREGLDSLEGLGSLESRIRFADDVPEIYRRKVIDAARAVDVRHNVSV